MFSALLMLLILAMNFKPCADELPLKVNAKEYSFQKEANHQDENDDCSPFCYCACCSVRTVTKTEVSLSFYLQNIAELLPSHFSGKAITVAFPVWQPPKTA